MAPFLAFSYVGIKGLIGIIGYLMLLKIKTYNVRPFKTFETFNDDFRMECQLFNDWPGYWADAAG